MSTLELWQQRLREIRAERNPHPHGTLRAAGWNLNRSCRCLGAMWARLIAPVIDHIVQLVEDRP